MVFFVKIENLLKKLLKISFSRIAAVIFIVSVSLFLTQAISRSFTNADLSINEDQAIVINASYLYANKYLNPPDIVVEELYGNGDYYQDENTIVQNNAFLANNCPSLFSPLIGGTRSSIVEYEVRQGDIPSEIAAAFGISTNTLLWANNLSAWDKIKVGQKLIILPVSGVKYTIKKGDTLESILKKYKGDLEKTIAFNALPANGNLTIGQEIIIPDGQKPVEYRPTTTYAHYTPEELGPYGKDSHKFPWGQCTWYVAQKKYIPWGGNAKTWLKQATAYGFATGMEPSIGSILVTKENRYYGHVAYVEAVGPDTITVSEMNLGNGIKRIRTISKDSWIILGYIY
jgi:surface antigen